MFICVSVRVRVTVCVVRVYIITLNFVEAWVQDGCACVCV